jgi:hypothetical protein
VPETVRAAAATAEASDAHFTAPDEVWVVEFEEAGPNTLIGSGDGLSLPASGRYWIEPVSGRLIMTELILRNAAIEAIIDVRYEEVATVGQLVPIVMRERYRDLRRNSLVEGTATYSRVRRFQVTTSEVVAEPPR